MTTSVTSHHEERFIDLANGIRLWADATGRPDARALLLVMGANATGIAWPQPLVTRLAEHHRVCSPFGAITPSPLPPTNQARSGHPGDRRFRTDS